METALTGTTTSTEFALDITVVTDVPAGTSATPCATDDGCESTCASACTSSAA